MDKNFHKELWEKRGKKFGRRIEGVLPKSWPRKLNLYLDAWMWRTVSRAVPEFGNAKVLDLGCGYGRLSKKILDKFPRSRTYGVDIAASYVDIYNQDLSPRGKALVGDIRKLPFKDNFFDTVFIVTTLMYVTSERDQRKVLNEIMRVLKKDGKFVIIERNGFGHNFINLFGLIPLLRGTKFKEIDAVSFSKSKMVGIIRKSKATVEVIEGIPLFTLSFYPLFVLCKLKMENFLLKFIRNMDDKFGRLVLTLSLYMSYSGRKS